MINKKRNYKHIDKGQDTFNDKVIKAIVNILSFPLTACIWLCVGLYNLMVVGLVYLIHKIRKNKMKKII